MSARTLKAKGFTLVEILIVVVILGILAAIVIPQFTSASESAKASSLVTQLQSLRSQLELYQLEHNGNYPGTTAVTGAAFVSSADFWADLTGETNIDGEAADSSDLRVYGPYLQKEVTNPFEDSTTVVTTGAADNGWLYDVSDGSIKAIVALTKAVETNLVDSDATAGNAEDDFFLY